MELEITTRRVLRVWWAYFWRNFLGLLLATLLAVLFGIMLGMAGTDPDATINQILIRAIGVVLTLAATIIPIQMILGKDFGEFRLVLLSRTIPPIVPARPASSVEKSDAQVV